MLLQQIVLDERTRACTAVDSISTGWMSPWRSRVVSGVSLSEGSAAITWAASRAAFTIFPKAIAVWMSTPVTRSPRVG